MIGSLENTWKNAAYRTYSPADGGWDGGPGTIPFKTEVKIKSQNKL